jgi:hypothetical protein
MSMSICLLNLSAISNNYIDVVQFYNNSVPEHDLCKLVRFTLFAGNQVSIPIGSYSPGDVDKLTSVTIPDSVTVSLKFRGFINFSLLLRPTYRVRISTSVPNLFPIHAGVEQNYNLFVYTICDIIHDILGLEIDKSSFDILLFNGVYNLNHSLNNDDFSQILNSGLFPVVLPPDFSGVRRRKGTIKMYLFNNKKRGTIIVNKKNFHLLGFTSIRDVQDAIGKLDLLVIYI